MDANVGALFALAAERLLNVREVRVDNPGNVEIDSFDTMIRYATGHVQRCDADVERDVDGQGAMRNTASVARDGVVGVASSTAAEFRELGMDIKKAQRLRVARGRLTQPRCFSVDLEPQRSQVSRFAKVKSAETIVVVAVAALVRDQQRLTMPGVALVWTDVAGRHARNACGANWHDCGCHLCISGSRRRTDEVDSEIRSLVYGVLLDDRRRFAARLVTQ